ncbi:hypothetical protein H4W31_006599 [Plantactinospora soyae]|uniref:Uncharacterized protein n=1 Tax=Plantactinospora soyae TaxID=1544732 RepID=A0A927MD76_9ACTN|nr:hypothetical protein [Plantactinospora soyae]MBE1490961.1 hypothetical protein [Plantactinospora soyae]
MYVDAYLPDTHLAVLSLTSAVPGSVFAAEASTVFDQVAIPGADPGVVNLYVKPSVFGKAFADKTTPAKDVRGAGRPAAPPGPERPDRGVRRAGLARHSLVVADRQSGRRHPRRRADRHVQEGQGAHHRDQRPHLSMVTVPGAVTNQIEAAAKATS